mgnify:FL=1
MAARGGGAWLARVTEMDERRIERAILTPVTDEQVAQAKETQTR